MWHNKAAVDEEQDIPSSDPCFESAEDYEGEGINLAKISDHCNVIFRSDALAWLISSLQTRSFLQWERDGTEDLAVNEIRQRILEALPSGKITKRQRPREHQITFRLQWGNVLNRPWRERETIQGAMVITTCSGKAQMAPVGQYIGQTWPRSSGHIFRLLDCAIRLRPGSRETQNSKLHCTVHPLELTLSTSPVGGWNANSLAA